MRKWILGFSVEKVCEEGLDLKDIHILRYVIDFMDSGKTMKRNFGREAYHWITNKNILENNPLLEINLTKSLRKRMKVLVEKELLDYKLYKNGVSQTFYKKGRRLELILDQKQRRKKIEENLYREIGNEDWED
ncbi:hypothetical protein [uncultured Clostridium sp.]|uniref:hypothetical protein n=1 Tax=uncultured Clostridium sp. TaxID=59620 RepID=UPI002633464C|nr:hypothetical protein [uncultured Clostridium sp.]